MVSRGGYGKYGLVGNFYYVIEKAFQMGRVSKMFFF